MQVEEEPPTTEESCPRARSDGLGIRKETIKVDTFSKLQQTPQQGRRSAGSVTARLASKCRLFSLEVHCVDCTRRIRDQARRSGSRRVVSQSLLRIWVVRLASGE